MQSRDEYKKTLLLHDEIIIYEMLSDYKGKKNHL